ncbi:MAG: hypothetical protein WC483_05140 [Candidatus Paceibacterota bacterium]
MYIQGVWFNEAIYYHNDRCKVCSTGQKYPHTECKQKTTTYYDRTLRKNVSYTYYACEKIDSCGADKCDYSKNTTKGLGAYEDYDVYGKAYTSYDKYVSESSECIPKPTIPTKPTTPSTGPTIPTDRYVCDPKAEKVDGYGKCILDNQNKYPTAKSCNKANNKVKFIDIPCNGKDNVTCLKPISYNTDCIDGASNPPKTTPKPTTPPPTKSEPISPITCRIPIFGFYDQLSQPPKYLYNLFTTKKIVENPTLEYYAENCESCKLVITSEDGNSVDEFIIDNSAFQNNLEPTTIIDEKNNRYAFEASNIKLDTKRLKSGNYILSINCYDPILGGPVTGMRKFTNDEEFPPWLKLTIAPEIR